MSVNREVCFVIMPFSKTAGHTESHWTQHFSTFLKPLIEENPTLEAQRSEALRGDIVRQIITHLVTSRVVVADLTDNNCNVYWELGVRQSFKHGTVTIAEEGTELPFDISTKGTLTYYPNNHLKMAEFRQVFKEAIQDCLENPSIPDSHVLETLGGRGTLFEVFYRDETIRRLDAVLFECDVNTALIEEVKKTVEANQKDPKHRSFNNSRYKQSSAELLAANRYVAEDDSFFYIVENYLRWAEALNTKLNIWHVVPESFEKSFSKDYSIYKEVAGRFRTAVEQARDKVIKRL